MKWIKNEALLSVLCVIPSLVLIIVTILAVPRIAGQANAHEENTEKETDIQMEDLKMTDISAPVQSGVFESQIETDVTEISGLDQLDIPESQPETGTFSQSDESEYQLETIGDSESEYQSIPNSQTSESSERFF